MLFHSLNVSGPILPNSRCVKNLGAIIDKKVTLNNHITYICNSCYHYLKNIRTVWQYLTTSSAKIIVHSIILYSCKYLFHDIRDFFITKLQHVQNAVRIVLNMKKHVTPYLTKLHWLPVRQCIVHNLNLIVFKALKGDYIIAKRTHSNRKR